MRIVVKRDVVASNEWNELCDRVASILEIHRNSGHKILAVVPLPSRIAELDSVAIFSEIEVNA
jgi:hypothetical protein